MSFSDDAFRIEFETRFGPTGAETPLSGPYLKLEEFPFLIIGPSGVIRMGSPV